MWGTHPHSSWGVACPLPPHMVSGVASSERARESERERDPCTKSAMSSLGIHRLSTGPTPARQSHTLHLPVTALTSLCMPPPRRLQRSDECDGAPTPTVDELLPRLDTTRYTIDQKRVVRCTSCAYTVPILGLGAGAGKPKRTAVEDLAEHTRTHIAIAAQKKNDTASTSQPSRQAALADFFRVSESSKARVFLDRLSLCRLCAWTTQAGQHRRRVQPCPTCA